MHTNLLNITEPQLLKDWVTYQLLDILFMYWTQHDFQHK